MGDYKESDERRVLKRDGGPLWYNVIQSNLIQYAFIHSNLIQYTPIQSNGNLIQYTIIYSNLMQYTLSTI